MGIGDEVMATGFARGAAARGKRVAFGDGRRIIWGPWCNEAFRHNPNIATRVESNIEWINYYKGNRGYNSPDSGKRRWIWNYDFRAPRGEFFFDALEMARALKRPGTVLIEPNVPWHKSVAVNKDWGRRRYQQVADSLLAKGWRVFQTYPHGIKRLERVELIGASEYRQAAAILASVDLGIMPEGGLHHAAAAVGTYAIVIHGGFTPPAVLGYCDHVNLTGGTQACGNWDRCSHCRAALDAIEVDHVVELADAALCQKNSATSPRAG
jgi:Glycosyltransferase family 9 (heptosyltransferase)